MWNKNCSTMLGSAPHAVRLLAGSGQKTPSWRTQLPGLTVLASYLLIGTGLWFAVLRTQPFLTVGSSADGPATGGGQELPQNHPPVKLPEEVHKRITEFAEQAKQKPQDVGTWKSLAEMQFRAVADRGELSQCRARIVQACSRACRTTSTHSGAWGISTTTSKSTRKRSSIINVTSPRNPTM